MKFFQKYKKTKILVIILILIPILYDGKNMFIDTYNFWQLLKAKPVLESIKPGDIEFSGLSSFNEIYNIDIKPIKNCYSITNNNGKYNYLFAFKLESYMYTYIHGGENYSYPGYDIPIWDVCVSGGCVDASEKIFKKTISNPCREQ